MCHWYRYIVHKCKLSINRAKYWFGSILYGYFSLVDKFWFGFLRLKILKYYNWIRERRLAEKYNSYKLSEVNYVYFTALFIIFFELIIPVEKFTSLPVRRILITRQNWKFLEFLLWSVFGCGDRIICLIYKINMTKKRSAMNVDLFFTVLSIIRWRQYTLIRLQRLR